MKGFKLLIARLFGIDPVLLDAMDRTEKVKATVDGDIDWMLSCKPLIEPEKKIVCDDNNTYKKVKDV